MSEPEPLEPDRHDVSRTLDVLIATRLLGWHSIVWRSARQYDPLNTGPAADIPFEPTGLRTSYTRRARNPVHEYIPHFSREITDAWQIVTLLSNHGLTITLDISPSSTRATLHGPAIPTILSLAHSTQLAICRVALKVPSLKKP